MFVLTINDRVGTAAGFSGVRAFIGCEDQAKLIAARIRRFGCSVSTKDVPLAELPERSKAELETVATVMEIVNTD